MKKQEFNELKTERLDLHPICLEPSFELANYLFNLISSNRDFFKYMPWSNIKTPEQEYEFLQGAAAKWKDNKAATYGLYLKGTNEYVGCCSVMNLNFSNSSCEIGYWLNPKHAKQGFMAEAVNAVTKEFFDRGAKRIVIKADITNTNSRHVAERCGFVCEGIAKQSEYYPATDTYGDVAVYANIKEN